MADLSYNDIQRAVQDGLKVLQNDLQRLSNTVDLIERQAQRIEDMDIMLKEFQRTLQLMDTNILAIKQGSVDPRAAQVLNDIHDLKIRFATVEKFAQQMSDYMQERHQEEQEDRQYRAA